MVVVVVVGGMPVLVVHELGLCVRILIHIHIQIHTYTHTHTHTLSHTRSYTRSYTLTLPLTHSLTNTHTQSLLNTLYLPPTHSYSPLPPHSPVTDWDVCLRPSETTTRCICQSEYSVFDSQGIEYYSFGGPLRTLSDDAAWCVASPESCANASVLNVLSLGQPTRLNVARVVPNVCVEGGGMGVGYVYVGMVCAGMVSIGMVCIVGECGNGCYTHTHIHTHTHTHTHTQHHHHQDSYITTVASTGDNPYRGCEGLRNVSFLGRTVPFALDTATPVTVNAAACCGLCRSYEDCQGFTYYRGNGSCLLLANITSVVGDMQAVSGINNNYNGSMCGTSLICK